MWRQGVDRETDRENYPFLPSSTRSSGSKTPPDLNVKPTLSEFNQFVTEYGKNLIYYTNYITNKSKFKRFFNFSNLTTVLFLLADR